jgi:hypothetical protein
MLGHRIKISPLGEQEGPAQYESVRRLRIDNHAAAGSLSQSPNWEGVPARSVNTPAAICFICLLSFYRWLPQDCN